MLSVQITIGCGNLSARHGSREAGRGKGTVPCLVPFPGGTRLGPLPPPPPLTHTPHSFQKYLKTEIGANVLSKDSRDGAPPQTRTRGQRPLGIHVRPAVPGQRQKRQMALLTFWIPDLAGKPPTALRNAKECNLDPFRRQLGTPITKHDHHRVEVFLLRWNRDRDAMEPGVFLTCAEARKNVAQRFEKHIEVYSHVRSGMRAAVKTQTVFTPAHQTSSTRSLLAHRLVEVFSDGHNEGPRSDDSCGFNDATRMFEIISASTELSVGALAYLVSTLPTEAVLEETAREMPLVVACPLGRSQQRTPDEWARSLSLEAAPSIEGQ